MRWIALSVLVFSSALSQSPGIRYYGKTQREQDIEKAAFKILDQRCGFTTKWSTEVDSIWVMLDTDFVNNQCMSEECDNFRWKKKALVSISFKRGGPQRMPQRIKNINTILQYALGSGRRPGITTQYAAEIELCVGKPIFKDDESHLGDSLFIDEPQLKYVRF